MKLAISATEASLDAPIDPRFGRAACFVIVDTDGNAATMIDNTANQAATHGAGLQAAKVIIEAGAAAVISGHVGPKAFDVLHPAGVKIFHAENTTVRQAAQSYQKGQLQQVFSATV